MRERWACLRGDINLQISITFAQYLTHVVYNKLSTSRGVFWKFPNNAHHFIFLYPVEVSEMYDSETSMYNIYEKMFRFDTAFCINIYIYTHYGVFGLQFKYVTISVVIYFYASKEAEIILQTW